MPFKHHEPNRHHIPKSKYKVTNWAEYDRGLVQRGDIRFWIDQEAIKAWIAPYRTTPDGQRKFSNFEIEATLILGAVFKMPLRQTEGFVRSLMQIIGLDLPVPDHTTLARRRRTVEVKTRPDTKHPLISYCIVAASSFMEPANGPVTSTVKRGAHGGNYISQWTQAQAKSLLMN